MDSSRETSDEAGPPVEPTRKEEVEEGAGRTGVNQDTEGDLRPNGPGSASSENWERSGLAGSSRQIQSLVVEVSDTLLFPKLVAGPADFVCKRGLMLDIAIIRCPRLAFRMPRATPRTCVDWVTTSWLTEVKCACVCMWAGGRGRARMGGGM